MKQGWLFATRKNRTLFSNCKRRMENSLLLLQCFMAGVMLIIGAVCVYLIKETKGEQAKA